MASCFSIWYSIFCSAICGDHSSFTKTSATACAAARAEREGRRAVRASARRCGVTGSDGVQRRARRAAHLKLSVDGRGDRAQGGVHRCRVWVGGHGSSEWWAQATSPQPQRRSPATGAFARDAQHRSRMRPILPLASSPRPPAGGSQILASLPQHKERGRARTQGQRRALAVRPLRGRNTFAVRLRYNVPPGPPEAARNRERRRSLS
jgi:hypothetical protein